MADERASRSGSPILAAVFGVGGFGFGLAMSGGLIDDGFIKPLTGYWFGVALLAPSLIVCVCLAARKMRTLQ